MRRVREPAPQSYLFDLDGTLVDTAPDLMRALNHALATMDLRPVDEALTRHWVGHGVRAMLQAAFAHHAQDLAPERVDALEASCVGYYGAHVADYSRPYPHVMETLAVLAERAPLAVVTNKPTALSESLLEALDMTRFFGVIVGRGTTAKPKPDAAPALHACESLGVDPASALFVGDSETDVACARTAGCAVAIYRHGYNHGIAPEALGADRVIDSFADLV